MALRPFTPEWADAFRAVVSADAAYRAAAAKWTWPLALVLRPAPEYGYPDALAMELALDRGNCHAASIVAANDVTAELVLSAPYAVWKSVVRGELDPIVGVTRGAIAVQGPLTMLMMHAKAAMALLACAQAVPSTFPDDA
ncbi:MAG: SCP2 sterol-binding domain-containing protein [Gemmatimonadaceae bacterium]|nr:SCP2 sterol-binding domain-containing protein [Gemmatimonadaceae bacterium]MCW5826923.1 SCP2 sterol-binding domain-containing protein [Gemmatimonadaceae bacterium]